LYQTLYVTTIIFLVKAKNNFYLFRFLVVPRFLDGAVEIFGASIGENNVEKKNNSRIVRRDTQTDQIHVFDAYDIGSSFKAITVNFADFSIVQSLLNSFNGEVISIIPDRDIKFDLPTNKKAALRRRYYIRSSKKPAPAKRQGNFDFDTYEHDKNCPYAHTAEKKIDSLIHKRAATTKKKTTTKKTTKKTAIKKTTAKKATATKTSTIKDSSTSCYPGSSGMKNGDGYNGYCCTSSDDCKDTCISGKVNKMSTFFFIERIND
jgi:hypothetical protein